MQSSICLAFLLVFSFCKLEVNGTNVTDILKMTRPAYAVAVESRLLNNSSACRRELETFRKAVDDREPWSLIMLDASGEPKAGFLYGNKFWLGVKTMCLNLYRENDSTEYDKQRFPVNYYAAHFQYHLREKLTSTLILGLCLPDVCTTDELSGILKNVFKTNQSLMISDLYGLDYNLLEVRDLKDDNDYLWNWKSITILIILIITLVLMVTGTIYDVFVHQKRLKIQEIARKKHENDNGTNGDLSSATETPHGYSVALKKEKKSTLGEIFLCFSVHTNSKSLFHTNRESDSVQVVYAMKFLFMAWIIMFNSTAELFNDYTDNGRRIRDNLLENIISHGSIASDTNFFMSGLFLAHVFYQHEDQKRLQGKPPTKFSFRTIVEAICKRFIKVVPAYIMTIGAVYIGFSRFSKVTQFSLSSKPQMNCEKNWWANLLYVSNFLSYRDMCITWNSWYLSNEMQFFIIGQIILVCSVTSFKTSAALWSCFTAITIVSSGFLSYYLDFTFTHPKIEETMDIMNKSPSLRIGPYLIGMATAYLVINVTKKESNMKTKTFCLVLWILALVAIFVNVYLHLRVYSVVTTAIYIALGRTTWSLAMGWVVIACSTGHGGFVNAILSRDVFVPLSRLTYCAYLINPVVIALTCYDTDVPLHADMMIQGPMLLGIVIMTYTCAYILHIMFEAPYNSLLTVFANRSTKK